MPHAFTIKSYEDLSHKGAYVTPDGMYVTNNILGIGEKVERCNDSFGYQTGYQQRGEDARKL